MRSLFALCSGAGSRKTVSLGQAFLVSRGTGSRTSPTQMSKSAGAQAPSGAGVVCKHISTSSRMLRVTSDDLSAGETELFLTCPAASAFYFLLAVG